MFIVPTPERGNEKLQLSLGRDGVCNPVPNVSAMSELFNQSQTFRTGQHAPAGFVTLTYALALTESLASSNLPAAAISL